MDAVIRNQGASTKTLEIQIRKMSKVIQERGFGSLLNSTKVNLRDHVKSISTIVEADSYLIRRIHWTESYTKSYLKASHIKNSIPKKEKDPRNFTLPCFINNFCFDNTLVDLGASVSVIPLSTYLNLGLGELSHTKLTVELADRIVKYLKRIPENVLVGIGSNVSVMPLSTYLNLGLGELANTKLTVELADRTVKYPKGIAENVLVSIGKFVFPVEFIILDMPEDIKVPNPLEKSLDPLNGDYIELNDVNEPLELRRNQCDDLMPTIKEGEVIKEFRTRDDELDTRIDDYPCYCDYDKKNYIDYAHNLKFHNSIMKDKMMYIGNNVVGALMNVPIFVGTFSVVTDFAVLEDMDAYRDEGMGDVIIGEPFLKEIGIKARRFDGIITIYNGNNEVTYQMVRSHPRFIRHTNEQCNKSPPLLKVIEEDMMNGISHAYQKLKRFYKGVLNLGPDYI
ncbi:hypothetical protein Tco_0746928 [Tanacetum coccineum]